MPVHIMVVDDSAMIRMQAGRTLRESGFEVIFAVDGRDACDKLETGPMPAMIVCDVNMPRMNGLEFLEVFAERYADTGVPVLMLTTEGQPEMIRRARQLGAKAWLVKPFKPDLLEAAVQKLVLLQEA